MIVYHASAVLPVAAAPVRDGALAVHAGRIVAVGAADLVAAAAARAGGPVERRRLGRAIILPGLVNAHTHLELSWARDAVAATGDWVDWLRELLAARAGVDARDARSAAERSLAQMVERGTVAVGDVGNETWAAPLVAREGLHGVAFLEVYGLREASAADAVATALAQCDALRAEPRLAEAAGRLRVVATPHAPHTTAPAIVRALAGQAAVERAPLSVHVAESAAECAWLLDGSGPLAALYRERGFADAGSTPQHCSPVACLHRAGALGPRTLAVHAVHVDARDRELLRESGATVVTCPRSNRRLGVGVAPLPLFLRAGVPVALGTDSLASAPDLDLFAEMAALRAEHPGLPAAAIVRMATLGGARALGLDDRLGSLAPGKLAAAIVVPFPPGCDDPADALCSLPAQVFRLDAAPWNGA